MTTRCSRLFAARAWWPRLWLDGLERQASQGTIVVIPRIKGTRASPAHAWAVAKTMQIDTPGAIKLTRQYGDALLCVRYRLSPDGKERITTIELELERVTVQRKANPVVAVKIYFSEIKLIPGSVTLSN